MGKIAVVGDIMVDRYSYGDIQRLNPENVAAPLVLRDKEKEEYKLWGAANVAANIASLLNEVILVGAIANDDAGRRIIEETRKQRISFTPVYGEDPKMTTVKHRIIGANKYLLRVDDEMPLVMSEYQSNRVVKTLQKYEPEYIVVSDYAKGMVTPQLVEALQAGMKKWTKLLVDTKPMNAHMFHGAYLIKPNFKEFCEMIGDKNMPNDDTHVAEAGRVLSNKYGANIMVTRSEKGATLITKTGQVVHLPTHAKDVVDVSWAGDTFIAAVVVALNQWKSLEEAMDYGNKASWVVVGKMGTAIITPEEMGN